VGERLGPGRAHEPGAGLDHLARVRGSADARDAVGAERGVEQSGGSRAIGRDEPLGERHYPRAIGDSEAAQLLDHLADALGGDGEQDQVRALEVLLLGAEEGDPEVARQLDAGEVAPVLVRTAELVRLLACTAQQYGPNAGPLEQDGHGRAERTGPDDRGTTRMLAGVADGRGR
jgi:hypothetical protein